MVSKFEDLYCVASGNSLRGFDFKRLKNQHVITVNDNYQFIDAEYLVILDKSFFKKKALNNKSHHENLKNYKGVIFSNSYKRIKTRPTPELSHKLALINSGLCALLISLKFQYKRLFLLGFDMYRNEYVHHFDKEAIAHDAYFDRVTTAINGLEIETHNIYNASIDSRIDRFKKIDLDMLPL